MDERERPYHEVADLFPLMQGEEYEQLKADIAANGLREPIWLHPDGSIVDGRNRHRACIETDTPPRFRTWEGRGSLVAFVVSLNLHRRHLSSSQQAAIATDAEDLVARLEAEARSRQLSGTKQDLDQRFDQGSNGNGRAPQVDEQLATIFETNRQYVSDAKKLKREAPDLHEAVKAGSMSIPKAKRELNHRNKVEPPPMEGKYRVIYADPPWSYDNSGFDQSAAQHYPTMSIDDICELPVRDLADAPSVLYMWATVPLLPEAIRVMESWGFQYKTHRIWKKDRAPGLGWWGQTYHELLLIGAANGNYHPSDKLPSVVEAPVGKHSKKPAIFRHQIEQVHDGPYIELFAREAPQGWEIWGNEDVQQ